MEPSEEQAEKQAQERVAGQMLAAGLAGVLLYSASLFWPDRASSEGAGPIDYLLSSRDPLFWLAALAGLIYATLSLHYALRFILARGQWVHFYSEHWEEHESYVLVQFALVVAMALIQFLLLPHLMPSQG